MTQNTPEAVFIVDQPVLPSPNNPPTEFPSIDNPISTTPDASNPAASDNSNPATSSNSSNPVTTTGNSNPATTADNSNPTTATESPSNALHETNARRLTPADITDLILVTGQSNALGASTSYDARLDEPHERVFAFTDQGWQQASLAQVWDLDWHPRNHPETDPSNNFALHFGKRLATIAPDRTVGFVLVTAPGQAISHWRYQGSFYRKMESKLLTAINQLPHKSSIDGILWHQGETDANDTQTYTDALYTLIYNLRTEPWAEFNTPFICGETAQLAVNNRLNGLNRDSDPKTSCVRANDLTTLADGHHFDAAGLRAIGTRYADAYFNITNQ